MKCLYELLILAVLIVACSSDETEQADAFTGRWNFTSTMHQYHVSFLVEKNNDGTYMINETFIDYMGIHVTGNTGTISPIINNACTLIKVAKNTDEFSIELTNLVFEPEHKRAKFQSCVLILNGTASQWEYNKYLGKE